VIRGGVATPSNDSEEEEGGSAMRRRWEREPRVLSDLTNHGRSCGSPQEVGVVLLLGLGENGHFQHINGEGFDGDAMAEIKDRTVSITTVLS
jgi:hypothetical protein